MNTDIEKQPSKPDTGLITEGPNPLGKFYFALDWLSLIIILIASIAIDSLTTPFQRQFLITDVTISYAQKPDTITYTTAGAISILIPFIAIILCAILAPPKHRFLETYRGLKGLAISVIITLLLTNIFKVTVGELRPYFLSVCIPVANVCTGNAAEITEARKSFLSGHTSIAFSGLFYLSLFLVRAFRFRFSHVKNFESFKNAEFNSNYRARFFLYSIIVAPTMGATLIGLSRISDYHHNPHDVIFGLILGVLMAIGALRLQFPSFFLTPEDEKDN